MEIQSDPLTMELTIERIRQSHWLRARVTFALPVRVFDEPLEALDEPYLTQLLSDERFWALAALADEDVVGGAIAWTLAVDDDDAHARADNNACRAALVFPKLRLWITAFSRRRPGVTV